MDILIVDEDQATSKGLGLALKKYFENITITNSPVNAKKLIKKNKYSIIITEVNFSTVNGFDVLKAFKTTSPDTSIIVISAHISENIHQEILEIGVQSIFEKPISMNLLKSEINLLTPKRKD